MKYTLEVSGRAVEIEISRLGPDRFQYRLGDGPTTVVQATLRPGLVHLLQGDASHAVKTGARGAETQVHTSGRATLVAVQDERQRRKAKSQGETGTGRQVLRSPMPGKIVKLLVEVGQAVTAGQGVIVVEAMKMENELRAARAGVVQAISVQAGDTVEGNSELVIIDSGEG